MKRLYCLIAFIFFVGLPVHQIAASHHIPAFDKTFFRRLTVDDGLSQGTVNAIAQDKRGFMWFGTNDGLNRYDGYGFEIFRRVPGNENSLSSNVINSLAIDPQCRLWVGTDRGLTSICLDDGQIKRWCNTHLPDDINVLSLAFDRDSVLWIATANHGLFSLHPASGKVKAYSNQHNPDKGLPVIELTMVYADSSNRVWVADAAGGLHLHDRQTGRFRIIERSVSTPVLRTIPFITGMQEDDKGILWFVSNGGGLESIDPETLQVERHPAAASPVRNMYNFRDIRIMDENTFWIADIFGSGLLKYNPATKTSTTYAVGSGKGQLLMYDFKSLYVDRDQNLWAGSHGRGINMLPADQRPFMTMTASEEADIPLPFSSMRGIHAENDKEVYVTGYYGFVKVDIVNETVENMLDGYWTIFSLLRDVNDANVFWLGTESSGLYRMNIRERRAEQVRGIRSAERNGQNADAIVGLLVYSLLQTDDGVLYAGTDTGLNIYDPGSETVQYFRNDPDDPTSLPPGEIISLFEDSSGAIWIGSTTGGMARFNKEKQDFTRFAPRGEPGSMLSNRVNAFYEDQDGNFWIGTNMGLHQMDRKNGHFEVLLTADGLPNDVIYGILEDGDGRLWLSTNHGISAFNPSKNTFRNFSRLDGLPGNEFNTGSYFQSSENRMFFGGVEGLVAFDPSLIKACEWQPKPVITKVSYYGAEKSRSKLFTDIQEITWDKDVSMITVEYSSLNYSGFGKSRYAYSIDGLTGHKIEVGHQRQITLTRPKPGTYNFTIHATDSGGLWGKEPLVFRMIVLPTFQETLVFRILVIMAVTLMVLSFFLLRLRAINIQKRKLAIQVHKQTQELKISNKALQESNASKDMFFSIIAHDLKNPFNALLGFSEMLEDQWSELHEDKRKHFVKIIRSTSEITYQLLLNLLDWSLLERYEESFSPVMHKPAETIEQVLKQLSAQSEMKQITLMTELADEDLEVWADPDMVSTILRNLVSNAIKFSHKGADVSIRMERTAEGMAQFCVTDKGVGIPHDKLQLIFKQRSASSKPGTHKEQGTGLGLLLCSEFVRRNGGKIWVESEEGKGSSFCFTLPMQAGRVIE